MQAEEQTDRNQRNGKYVGDDVMKGVDEEDRHHEADQDGVFVEKDVRYAEFEKQRDQ